MALLTRNGNMDVESKAVDYQSLIDEYVLDSTVTKYWTLNSGLSTWIHSLTQVLFLVTISYQPELSVTNGTLIVLSIKGKPYHE
jgi:hypothetical protein